MKKHKIMDWIENLKEPITKLDVLYFMSGYLIYKWGMIIFELIGKIYKNIKNKNYG